MITTFGMTNIARDDNSPSKLSIPYDTMSVTFTQTSLTIRALLKDEVVWEKHMTNVRPHDTFNLLNMRGQISVDVRNEN